MKKLMRRLIDPVLIPCFVSFSILELMISSTTATQAFPWSSLARHLDLPSFPILAELVQTAAAATARSGVTKLAESVNVRDFGAKGDGVTDDTAAFQAAFDNLPTGGVIFVPRSTSPYLIGSLTLVTKPGWTTLRLQGNLILRSPLSLPSDYAVIGESGSPGTQFSTSPSAQIQGVGLEAKGVINIVGSRHVTVENVTLSPLTATHGIYVEDSNDVRINNANAIFYEGAKAGSGILIRDSWGIYIHGGHINAASSNADPAILVTGTGRAGKTGNYTSYGIYLREVTISHRGVRFRRDAGAGSSGPWMQPIVVEDLLYESGLESPITFDTSSGAGIVGVTLNRIWPADNAAVFPLITVIGDQVYEVEVNFPVQARGSIVGGAQIHGLYVKSATASPYLSIGQDDEFQVNAVGRTGLGTASPSGTLSISGKGSGNGVSFIVSDSDNSPSFVIRDTGHVGIGTKSPTAQLHTTGSMRFAHLGAGTLTTDALGNLSVSSDETMKNVRGAFERGLADVVRISPILYQWKPETGYDTVETYAGLSAQNVQEFIPEAVSRDAHGRLTLQDRPLIAAVINAVREIGLVSAVFRKKLIVWLGDPSSGIDIIRSRESHSDLLCVGDTCLTAERFKALAAMAEHKCVSSELK